MPRTTGAKGRHNKYPDHITEIWREYKQIQMKNWKPVREDEKRK
jgi:hypothetical protein